MRKTNETSMTSLANASKKELYRLRYDHYSHGNFCILTDSQTVWLFEHPRGKSERQSFICSRRMFNRLITEYQKPKKFIRKPTPVHHPEEK